MAENAVDKSVRGFKYLGSSMASEFSQLEGTGQSVTTRLVETTAAAQ